MKDVLLEAGLTLASELSLPMVLQRIVDLAAQVTDARYGAMAVVDEGGAVEEFITTGLSTRQRRDIGALPQGKGLLGLVIREPRPIRIANIAEHKQSVGFPPHHPPMRSFLGAPVRALGKAYGNIYLTDKRSADEFTPEDEAALVILATQAGVAIANAWLYEELRSREQWLDALRDITNQILAGVDAPHLLESVAEHARQIAGADGATIVTLGGDPGELVVSAAVGAHSEELVGVSLPLEDSLSGRVIRSGQALRLDDVGADPRAYQRTVQMAEHGPALMVPLRVPGGATGTLEVANLKGGQRFDDRTLRRIETFADQASVAIDYGRAQTELQRMGLMEERERIARELHDGIIQSLFAVGMGLQGTAMVTTAPETALRIESAVEELDRVIRDLRNYIFGLRPGILADRQLDQALRVLAEQVQARGKASVEVDVDASLAATLSGRSADIVQLAREALSNATRHGEAALIVIRLARHGQKAVLTIEDNGSGFDPDARASGHGLRNMRERALSLNGTLEVTSRPGKGTRLSATFPI